jgi:hypothetical protein
MRGERRLKVKNKSKKRVIELLEIAAEVDSGLSTSNMEMLLNVQSRQDKSILVRSINSLYKIGRIVKFKGECRHIGCVTFFI